MRLLGTRNIEIPVPHAVYEDIKHLIDKLRRKKIPYEEGRARMAAYVRQYVTARNITYDTVRDTIVWAPERRPSVHAKAKR